MATKNDYPISLTLKLFDQLTGPLKNIGAHVKSLTAPIQDIGKGLKEFGQVSGVTHLAESMKGVGESAHHVIENVKELGKTFLEANVIGAAALYEGYKHSVELGSELKHAAERAGLTVDAFAQMRFAAGQAGVKSEEFGEAVDQLTKRLGEAKAGGGPLLEFLNKVSPVFAQQVKHAHGTQEAMGLLAKAFERVHDPAKRAALQNAAFGKSSKEMAEFLGQGSEAILAAMKSYFGIAGSQQEFADRSEDAEKAVKKFNAAMDGLRGASSGLMPVLTDLTGMATQFVASHRGDIKAWAEGAGKAIGDWANNGGLKRLAEGLEKVGHFAIDVVDKIGGLKGVAITAGIVMGGDFLVSVVGLIGAFNNLGIALGATQLKLTALVFGPVIAAVGDFILAIQAGYGPMEAFNLVLAANPIGALILGITALAGAAFLIYKNWEPIKTFFDELWESMKHPIDSLQHGMLGDMGAWIMGSNPDYDASAATRAPGAPAAGAPPGALATRHTNDSRVVVDFRNVPKGIRANIDQDSKADVGLNVGYQAAY